MQLIPSLMLCAMTGQPLMIAQQGMDELAVRVLGQQRQIDSESLRRPTDVLARTSHKYTVTDGIAHIELHGVMLAEPDWILDYFGVTYTVTAHFAAAIREAAARDDVRSILVDANTPGGSVVGLQSCYETVRDAAKPVICSVSGMLASAGVYVMAGADQIIAEPAAVIGSIGTVMRLADTAKMYADFGITVHQIASGPDKGVGSDGVAIAPEQLKPFQALVDQLAGQFVDVVAEGRRMPRDQVVALATGAAWIATEAKAKGLVDRIHSQPLTAAKAEGRAKRPVTNPNTQSQISDVPPAATAAQDALIAAQQRRAAAEAALVAEQQAHAASLAALAVVQARNEVLTQVRLSDANLNAEWQGMSMSKKAGFFYDFDTFAHWMREEVGASGAQ